MSRSKRHTPITGITTARSEKFEKQKWHRAIRTAEKVRLNTDPESEPHHEAEFTSAWVRRKDGKMYWPDMPYKHRRK